MTPSTLPDAELPHKNGPEQTIAPAPDESRNSAADGASDTSPLTDITVQLSGEDGIAILSRVGTALRRGGRRDLIEAFTREATSGDYDDLLRICQRYVHCR